MRILPRKFYNRPTIDVAIDLLGCHIIREKNGRRTGGMIVETEAYIGEDDPACHAASGMTPRNRIMYGPPGHLYVYFTYGNHFMLNVVTEREGFPSAVLLRGIEPVYNIESMARRRGVRNIRDIGSGPGKLAAALAVTGKENGADLLHPPVSIKGPSNSEFTIMASPRIGIGDRGPERLWRFYIDGNLGVTPTSARFRVSAMSLSEARRRKFSL